MVRGSYSDAGSCQKHVLRSLISLKLPFCATDDAAHTQLLRRACRSLRDTRSPSDKPESVSSCAEIYASSEGAGEENAILAVGLITVLNPRDAGFEMDLRYCGFSLARTFRSRCRSCVGGVGAGLGFFKRDNSVIRTNFLKQLLEPVIFFYLLILILLIFIIFVFIY